MYSHHFKPLSVIHEADHWDLLVKEAVKRRKERKISQRRLATIAEISQPTVSRFEQQKEDIQLSSAIKILDVLGLVEK